MREQLNDTQRIEHIIQAVNQLIENKDLYTLEELKNKPIEYYGFVKLVEIIGEATYKLSSEYKKSHQNFPWQLMEKMRHVLVHDYYRITAEALWTTIQYDIPELKKLLDEINIAD
ncbi:MAG: DUF86 domain-containing protein [Bacteroidales bacterium]|nr:DUF86 domain-containing protein [Bacteroidales bacterium]